MLPPSEIFNSLMLSDAQFMNHAKRNSFVDFKQKLIGLGFKSKQSNPFESSESTLYPIQSSNGVKTSFSFNKIDEWQEQQDQLMMQITQQKQESMYVPNYPIKQKFDLRSRFLQHNSQNLQINFSLDNKLQRTPSLIKNLIDSQIISDISEQQVVKIKDEELKKKSNLKTSKTVEKKSVKIEEKRKSQSELKKSTSSKPPKPGKSLKKQNSSSSISSAKKKATKPGIETVDSFLKNTGTEKSKKK